MPILGVIASSITTNLPTNSYQSIATVNVGSGGTATAVFSAIPNTYKHLQIRGIARTNRTGVSLENISMVFNSDTFTGNTNYAYHAISGDGTNDEAFGDGNFERQIPALITSTNAGASMFGAFVIDILDYADTNKNTTVRSLNGADLNGTSGTIRFTSGLYRQTTAVSTITMGFTIGGGAFNEFSSIALYGIKG